MRKLLALISFGVFLPLIAYSQIRGRVIDAETSAGLADASVFTASGLHFTSDADGYFSFSPGPEKSTVINFSFLGYKSISVGISNEIKFITVRMEPESQSIRELVVKVPGMPVRLMQATGSVSLLTRRSLMLHDEITLNEAINQVPGVYMSGGGYNTNRLTIRGIGSRSPYSSNRIRAYLDEIPLTSGDGITSIEDIDLAIIGRMEILKGPSSAVYGSGLGGAVRLWSVQPEADNFSAGLSSEVSSFNTFRTVVSSGYKYPDGTVSLVYANSHSEGYRQNSSYKRGSLFFKAERNLKNTGIKLTLLYTDLEAEIPSSLSETDYTNRPNMAAPNWLAVKGFETYKKLILGLTAETKLSRRIINRFSVFNTFSDPYESRPFNILDEQSKAGGFRENIQIKSGKFEFLTGGEMFLERYSWKIFETLGGDPGNLLSDNREKRYYLNFFGLATYNPGKSLTVEAGMNFNVLKYTLSELFGADSINQSGEYVYDPVYSPRLGINYRLGDGMNLHASLGHGFSAPSLEETLLPDGQINSALEPETGWNYDLGVRGEFFKDHLIFDLTVYHISLKNLLVTKRITEEIFTGINAGSTSHSGIESMLRWSILSPLVSERTELEITSSIAASVNRFNDFTDDNINYSGKNLPGIPSVSIYNEIRWKFIKNAEFTAFHKFAGKQYLNDDNSGSYNNWQTFDLRFNYQTVLKAQHFRIKLYGGIKNIFDRDYAGMILVNAPSFGASEPRYYYPALHRNYVLGMSVEIR